MTPKTVDNDSESSSQHRSQQESHINNPESQIELLKLSSQNNKPPQSTVYQVSSMDNPIENKWVDFEIKFGHNEGHTVFAINKHQNKLLTGGSDGEVRGWSVERTDDDDPESYDVGSSIYSIVTSVSAT